MAEAGYITLLAVLLAAVFSAAASLVAAGKGSARLEAAGRRGVLAVFGLYTLALAIILYAFLSKDFSLKIVASHASLDLPAIYTLSALYADKAGSMFLWGWLLSLFAAILALRRKNQPPELSCTLGILALMEIFFLSLVTFGANVFARHPSPPADGFGLNPLLQNLGMLIHPPLLYIGFAGFAVVFALIMAALIKHRPAVLWHNQVRRWTLFAWCTLGLGNLVGMWWSYNELGWGGYWAWDPVENAGLMPWLLGTAFLHSIAAGRKRNYLYTWSLLLIIFTFALTLLAPFITHGGIKSPLHGFYGSSFPPYILAAIIVTLTISLLLLYLRRKETIKAETTPSLTSREGAFLLTNIILTLLVFIILVGTVLPGFITSAEGTQIALGRSFFDRTCAPVMLILVFLMGLCPLLGWGKTAWYSFRRKLLPALLAIVIIAVAIIISGIGIWYAAATVICGLPLLTIFLEWYRGTRARRRSRGEKYFPALLKIISSNRARYGGFLVHIGIILVAIGIIASSFYNLEKTITLNPGESMSIGKYMLTYDELVIKQDNARVKAIVAMSVSRDGHPVGAMRPSYDYWFNAQDHFSEVAVRTTATEDLFVSLVWTSYSPANQAATFRVLVNPLIVWIWSGGFFLLLGGTIAFTSQEKTLSPPV